MFDFAVHCTLVETSRRKFNYVFHKRRRPPNDVSQKNAKGVQCCSTQRGTFNKAPLAPLYTGRMKLTRAKYWPVVSTERKGMLFQNSAFKGLEKMSLLWIPSGTSLMWSCAFPDFLPNEVVNNCLLIVNWPHAAISFHISELRSLRPKVMLNKLFYLRIYKIIINCGLFLLTNVSFNEGHFPIISRLSISIFGITYVVFSCCLIVFANWGVYRSEFVENYSVAIKGIRERFADGGCLHLKYNVQ